MNTLIPERYFPMPILQLALYNLTPFLRADIQPPIDEMIGVTLHTVQENLGDEAAAARLQQELLAVSIAQQAWQDHRSLRHLFYRAAFSQHEPAEEVLALLEQELRGTLAPLNPWGAGPIPEGAAATMEAARQHGAIAATIDEAAQSVSVVINTDAYPWPMVLRALSRVGTVATANVTAADSPEVTVRLQAGIDPHSLLEWFQTEVEKTDGIQPGLYPPAFALADTELPQADSAVPGVLSKPTNATTATAGEWVTIPVHLAVYPETAVHTALLTLEADFEGEVVGRDANVLTVRLRSRELPLRADTVSSAFKRELLIAAVQRRTREEAADLARLFASSAVSVRTDFQSMVRAERAGIRREEDNSPNIDPPEPVPHPDMPGCRIVFRDEVPGRAHYELNPERYPLPEILHLAAVLRPQAQISVLPGQAVHAVYLSARDSADFAAVEETFLSCLRMVDLQPALQS